MSQQLPGRGLAVLRARLAGAAAGWGRWGRRAPPRLAAWTRTACRWCVWVSILCPPVHDVLKCPPVPTPGTPKSPADCVHVRGQGLSCVVRHGAGRNFPRSHTLVVPVSWRSAAGGARMRREGGGTPRVICWGPLAGGRGRLPPASITFFSCVSFSLFSLCAKRFLTSHSFAKPSRLYG